MVLTMSAGERHKRREESFHLQNLDPTQGKISPHRSKAGNVERFHRALAKCFQPGSHLVDPNRKWWLSRVQRGGRGHRHGVERPGHQVQENIKSNLPTVSDEANAQAKRLLVGGPQEPSCFGKDTRGRKELFLQASPRSAAREQSPVKASSRALRGGTTQVPRQGLH